ncbi:MAG: ATP-dependent DNA helicase RecG [Clostridia bacterium]|nr:ATP-dependent DNA helicase RecG [Clostridia bacterium]
MITIDSSLTDLKGVGPKRAEALGRLGLFSVRDLLYFSPREHYDLREAKKIGELCHGEYAIVKIEEIEKPKVSYPVMRGRRTPLVTAVVSDGTGKLRLSWFNQPYIRNSIPEFAHGFVHGRVDLSNGRRMINAAFCPAPPGMLPVYPLTRGMGQASIRATVKSVMRELNGCYSESLPDGLRLEHGLCQLGFALENLHFPISPEALAIARRRLSFENVLHFTILLEALRAKAVSTGGISFETDGALDGFLSLLPFAPTRGQLDVMADIARDMASPAPMNRLIQGDVGSGKTILAFFAMFIAARNGFQAALMAPTALLAEQHYAQLSGYFGERAALLTSGMKKAEQREVLGRVKSGEIDYLVGTHSLIESGVDFLNLGVVITDEQHRFGVRQRALLGSKGRSPDVMIMSATPIPRTLSLILYGDLDISRLTEKPFGRKPVITRYVPPEKRLSMYRYIQKQIEELKVQAFTVCPMIEDNEEAGLMTSAESVFDELKKLLSVRIALVHGRMKADKRDEIMRAFRSGEYDMLVSTTVIEVGVDVPNACIMAVEAADRFGLAQLHQLRGRVGRSDKESYCFLLSESRSDTAMERIKTLVSSNDGFYIAEKDLETRGPGELLGARQHGSSGLIDSFVLTDMETLNEARLAAVKLLKSELPEDKKLVSETVKRYSAKLQNIAIN